MIKHIFLTLLLLTATLLAETDLRLNHYPRALEWLKDADTNGESAYNIGVLYHKEIKDNDKAIEWYKKAYKMSDEEASINSSVNIAAIYIDLKKYKKAENWYKKGITKGSSQANFGLGLLYKKMQRYNDAIFYYKKAYEMGNIKGAYSLGYLYDVDKHNFPNAITWYKKAANKGDSDAIQNLAYVYKDMKDRTTSAAYLIALIPYDYSKDKIFNRLKNIWKLDDETIKEAYKLQLKLDIPKHYRGGIN